jgi:hypothetical protein
MLLCFSSCASYHYAVIVGVAPEIEERYGEYISVEVDVAVLDMDQELEIKQAGVDEYFNPQTPLRERAKPQRILFDREDLDRQRVAVRTKAGKSLFVIADIPPVTGVNFEHDGRFLFLPLKKTVFAQKVYIEVDSTKIAQVDKKKLNQNRAKRMAQ